MPEYAAEAFVVMIHVHGGNGFAERAEFVVGCPTREAAEQRIKRFFPPDATVRVFASRLTGHETAALKLLPDEIRRRP